MGTLHPNARALFLGTFVACSFAGCGHELQGPKPSVDEGQEGTLCGDIEDEYDLDVDPTIVWDHPTIRELAGGISERLAAA